MSAERRTRRLGRRGRRARRSRQAAPPSGRVGPVQIWRRLGPEQRAAGIGAILLIVSTIGPFSFVEAAVVLVAAAVVLLLVRRAEEREFHLPFGDGTVVAVAGVWCALLIAVRVFDRPLGQNLLAIVCAGILVAAGVRQRARRPADDLPTAAPYLPGELLRDLDPDTEPATRSEARTRPLAPATEGDAPTVRVDDVEDPPEYDAPTRRLPER